jgi:hypothetical protein
MHTLPVTEERDHIQIVEWDDEAEEEAATTEEEELASVQQEIERLTRTRIHSEKAGRDATC